MKQSLIIVLCVLLLSTTGCASLSRKDVGTQSNLLEPSMSARFTDIPAPARFKFIPKESYAFESSGVRVGVLKYRGRATADQVLNFYKEQMPMNSWMLLNIIEYNQRIMNFEKNNESCIVTLLPSGSSVTVTVYIGPISQYPKKAGRPLK
ncbi:MAG: hypothetical protein PHG31_00390 [Candidatus Omnitrophica bacterium]|nr:hypothetical protein [Candidatus Omnitrophota bacterium]